MAQEKQAFRNKKEGALESFLASLAKCLPVSLVSALGGPGIAGLLVALTGAVALGVPAAYLGVRAMGWKPPARAAGSNTSAFGKVFGNVKGISESVLGEDAMRQLGAEGEGGHPDDETSLGYLIPEDIPKKEEGDKGDKEKVYKNADGKNVDSKTADELKSRYAKKEAGAGGGGLSGIGGGGGGGSGGQAMSGAGAQPSMGSGSGAGQSATGTMARGAKAAVKGGKVKIGTRKTGMMSGLKGATQIANRGYGVDQHAAGYQGAAFGDAPRSAAIVAGGPSAGVGGASLRDGGLADSPMPSMGGQSGEVTKKDDDPEEEDDGGMSPVVALLLSFIAVAALAVLLNQTAILSLARAGGWQRGIAYALAAVLATGLTVLSLALVAFMFMNNCGEAENEACASDAVRGIITALVIGITAAVSSLMFYTAATGNNLFGDSLKEFKNKPAEPIVPVEPPANPPTERVIRVLIQAAAPPATSPPEPPAEPPPEPPADSA